MKARTCVLILIAAVASSILLSCTDNGGSIYATLQTEKKVTDNTLPKTVTVTDIAVTTPGASYYVAAGGVFHGALAANVMTWTPNNATTDRPLNPTGNLCNALAFDGTKLWGGFIAAGGNTGLKFASLPFAGWIADPTKGSSAIQVVMLRAVNTSDLFLSSATGTTSLTYDLDYTTDGTTWITTSLTGLATPVVGVSWDGTNYWAITSAAIYYRAGIGAAFTALTTLPALAVGDAYRDIFADPSTVRIFVTTKKSAVYFSVDSGTTWTATTVSGPASTTVGFRTLAGPVDALEDKYLAGSDGYGYYTLSVGAKTLTRMADTTIALYSESISTIAVDGANVLLGTYGHGVWRAVFDATGALAASSAWTHE